MRLDTSVLAALATAFFWTVTALSFEYAGRRIGSFALNFLRLVLGSLFLGAYGLATRGRFLPSDAPAAAWLWLGASGLVGLVLGDLCLFQAFIDIGSRIAMLVYATAPAMTALLGFAVLGEGLGAVQAGGMALTLAGIALVVLGKRGAGETPARAAGAAGGGRRARGLALAFAAAVGQAGGLILSKLGAGSGAGAMDPFAGTQIRVLAGVAGFALLSAATGSLRGVLGALRDRRALASLGLGSFFGPFLGVSLSLLAVQSGNAAVASALMSLVPVLIIAPSALIMKERVTGREILGALVATGGAAVLALA
ncbi:MAG TPA: DMT family transporter [Spirochaetales bacterium]|nr:DMT family transporter [Spirochaetales bacterium]HRY55753.1 DMT family transporter [Spirochaetia bacterium]HRZ64397.1 DMT family transporter [Spirochaetia bacterium]